MRQNISVTRSVVPIVGAAFQCSAWNYTKRKRAFQITGFNLFCGSTFQTTAGAWQTGNFSATSSQVNCLDTIGNIFAITGVQLEAGGVATRVRAPAL